MTEYVSVCLITGYGAFQYKLLALCGWALSSDAIEVMCISFVLPAAASDLDLTDAKRGWLNSGMFLGKSTELVAIDIKFVALSIITACCFN